MSGENVFSLASFVFFVEIFFCMWYDKIYMCIF